MKNQAVHSISKLCCDDENQLCDDAEVEQDADAISVDNMLERSSVIVNAP